METAFLHALAAKDTLSLPGCVQSLLRFFPFRLSEEELRPVYVSLLRCAREGRMPESDEERAAALIFKELGFFEPVAELVPAADVKKRSCAESQLFMALSMR